MPAAAPALRPEWEGEVVEEELELDEEEEEDEDDAVVGGEEVEVLVFELGEPIGIDEVICCRS